jgi:thymidylate synthase ThyX
MEVTYPRFIHAEFMTHRMFSRNAASSRAIPVKKMLERVELDPAMPVFWGKNQSGMQANGELEEPQKSLAQFRWMEARDAALFHAQALLDLGLHKQLVNRILEPFSWITVIVTATEWSNFFALRRHPDAQPELHYVADLMFAAQEDSRPVAREWHMPYLQPDEDKLPLETQQGVSVARCARVSYLTHDGKREIAKDLELFDRLKNGSGTGHWSPFEHVAKAMNEPIRCGNFIGWSQFRKTFANECL